MSSDRQPGALIGRRRIHFDATDSTNSRAAELADDVAYDGTVVSADVQSQGRGQHGRIWQSPAGTNVLLSVLLFPPAALRRPPVLTAFAAVAVAETVERLTGQAPRIKWPNDVLIGDKKVAGILTEAGQRASAAGPFFVIGIGLNVNQREAEFAAAGLTSATSLAEAGGRPLTVEGVRDQLILELDSTYQGLCLGRIGPVEAAWRSRLGLVGRSVTVEFMDATERTGVLVEVGFDGLILAGRGGEPERIMGEAVRHVR